MTTFFEPFKLPVLFLLVQSSSANKNIILRLYFISSFCPSGKQRYLSFTIETKNVKRF